LNKNVAPKAENSLVRRRSPPSFTAKLLRAQGGEGGVRTRLFSALGA
jgi:hypothetical protein